MIRKTSDNESGRAAPRSLIVTIYGLYARDSDGWLSVSTLIRLMSALDVDEPAVRSSISRLKRRGILDAERRDGAAGYALSARGNEVLAEGDRRIFERPRSTLSDGWLLAVFSIPESEREKRHQLRSRLTWLGFGTVSSGVWIAPARLLDQTTEVLERYDLSAFVDLFSGDFLAFGDIARQIPEWWDLDGLQAMYEEFLCSYGPVLASWKRRRKDDDARAFRDYVNALTTWRRLPFLDPGLPAEVVPTDWHGTRAADLFHCLQQRIAEPAGRYARSMIG